MSRLHSSCGSTARRKAIYTSLYTDVVLFFFSFFSKTSASSRERVPLHWRSINPLRFILNHPCSTSLYTDVVLFFVSFFSKTSASSRAKLARENERGARERKCLFSSSPTTTPLRWRLINPLRFIFHHPFSTDFEEKIKGL